MNLPWKTGPAAHNTPPVVYEAGDFAALQKYTNDGKRRLAVLLAIAVALYGLTFVVERITGAKADPMLTYLVPALVVLAVLLRLTPQLAGSVELRMAKQAGLIVPQFFSFDEQCWRAKSERGTTENPWTTIVRLERDDERLFVFITPKVAYIVPKRVFAKSADFDHFATAAEQAFARSRG